MPMKPGANAHVATTPATLLEIAQTLADKLAAERVVTRRPSRYAYAKASRQRPTPADEQLPRDPYHDWIAAWRDDVERPGVPEQVPLVHAYLDKLRTRPHPSVIEAWHRYLATGRLDKTRRKGYTSDIDKARAVRWARQNQHGVNSWIRHLAKIRNPT